jgi:RNA polymerase sigma-70 factor, ECF subfamily
MLGRTPGGAVSNVTAVEIGEPGGVTRGATRVEDEVDDLILERARHGDPDAFAAILDHYDHRLRALAFRILRDRGAMDDALQDAAIKAFQALPVFRGDSSLGTWLYRITYTTCVNQLRRRHGLDDDVCPEPSLAGAAVSEVDPADVVAARLDLRGALDRLSPVQRAAVFLVIQEGYDLQTAGSILGIPTGTVASRLSNARAALRRALDEPRDDGEER